MTSKQVQHGLEEQDWTTRREIIRALVKSVKIGTDQVRITYRINALPFADGPLGGLCNIVGGVITPPCGVPRSERWAAVRPRSSRSTIGDSSHERIRCSTERSVIRI